MNWLLYVVTILVSISGTIGHTLTCLVLRRLRQDIKTALDSTTQQLMTGLAASELLFCATAIPLHIWNAAVGNAWPFTLPGVCYYARFWLFNLSSVALYHSTVIAVLRFVAVFKPVLYANVARCGIMRMFIVLIPWVLGCSAASVAYAAKLYRCGFEPYSGVCNAVPVESSAVLSVAAAQAQLEISNKITGLVGVLTPIILGCALYICVLLKLRCRQKRQRQVGLQLRRLRAIQPAVVDPSTAPKTASSAAHSATHTGAKLAFLKSSSVTGQAQSNTKARKNEINAARSYGAVVVIALVCFVNFAFICPVTLMYAFGMYHVTANSIPFLLNILYLLYYVGFCTTPFVYFASSTEMRSAYLKILPKRVNCGSAGKINVITVSQANNVVV